MLKEKDETRRNPFVSQVYFNLHGTEESLEPCCVSQSLRKSGLFQYEVGRKYCDRCGRSQSLRKSGLFQFLRETIYQTLQAQGRNPFVSQVYFNK